MAENIDAERDQYKFPMHLRYTMERASLVLKNSADIRRRELDEDQQSLIREVLDDLERACAESGLVARRTPSASIGEDGLPELPPQHDELSARWECDACDGRGHDGETHWQGHFQPPEPFPCSDCGGIGSHATDAYTADQMRQYARDAVAADRRARAGIPLPADCGRNLRMPGEKSPQAAQGVSINEDVEFQVRLCDVMVAAKTGQSVTTQSEKIQALTDWLDEQLSDLRAQLARQSQEEPLCTMRSAFDAIDFVAENNGPGRAHWALGKLKRVEFAAPPLSSEPQAEKGEK